jgi:tellurite resistance protein TerC
MRKCLIGLLGGTVLLIGIIMVILPGPAILVIPLGLGILATEFAWARSYKERFEAKWADLRNRRQKPT